MESEKSINRGGRTAKKNAEYFPMPGHRSDELKALKLEKGSVGIDIYLAIQEKICVSDYFCWNFDEEFRLQVFANENNFDLATIKDVLEYMVRVLNLYDRVLFEFGYVFSRNFVAQFETAGLFAQRKTKAADIFDYVNRLTTDKTKEKSEDDGLPF